MEEKRGKDKWRASGGKQRKKARRFCVWLEGCRKFLPVCLPPHRLTALPHLKTAAANKAFQPEAVA